MMWSASSKGEVFVSSVGPAHTFIVARCLPRGIHHLSHVTTGARGLSVHNRCMSDPFTNLAEKLAAVCPSGIGCGGGIWPIEHGGIPWRG